MLYIIGANHACAYCNVPLAFRVWTYVLCISSLDVMVRSAPCPPLLKLLRQLSQDMKSNQKNNPPAARDAATHIQGVVDDSGELGWVLWLLFAHETWVFMQHANVLLNPYLQV